MNVLWTLCTLPLTAAVVYYCTWPQGKQPDDKAPRGYIVRTKVVHNRFRPATAQHTFAYFTVFFLVQLKALEKGFLNLGRGWLFSYGGLYGRVTGLRSSTYLKADGDPYSITKRLRRCICDHGLCGEDLDDAWMLTMPSYLGLEGINPLTVYFCYRAEGHPWLVILEIHNTFGEKHVHVLQIKECDNSVLPQGFSHQWTFQRQFHVSPFNDRSGYYVVSVQIPVAPGLRTESGAHAGMDPCEPRVRVLLYTHSIPMGSAPTPSMGPLKLAAHLTPVSCAPLTSRNLVTSLAQQPLVLLLSLPRILFQAWILHYRKRLNVYIRPEPQPGTDGWGEMSSRSGGVGWQPETWIDGFARKRFEAFLGRRVQETHISVTLVSANPATPQQHFHPDDRSEQQEQSETPPSHATLTISYLSPAFFTMLFRAPSLCHAMLLFRSSSICHISSTEAFNTLFGMEEQNIPTRCSPSLAQRLRVQSIPAPVRSSRPDLRVPPRHAMDPKDTLSRAGLTTVLFIVATRAVEIVEKFTYRVTGARFVPGEEPWKRWDRALESTSPRQGYESFKLGQARLSRDSEDVGIAYLLGSSQD